MNTTQHGTNAGYQQHITARTPPCQRCRDAHTRYMASYHRKVAEAAIGLPPEAVDTVALALELELGGRVSAQALRWAAVIALRTALALLDAPGPGTAEGRPR